MLSQRDKEMMELLSREGLEFSEFLRDRNNSYFRTRRVPYFAVACALALCWTSHAKYEDAFVEYAAGYIAGGAKDHTASVRFCLRFGADELERALDGYRILFSRHHRIFPDFEHCDIHQLSRFQQRLLQLVNSDRQQGIIRGIGIWLFLGPFKIMLSDQNRLWNVDGIDAIDLPTGLEVDRAIRKLIREGYSFMEGFNVHWLEEGNGNLIDLFTISHMAHDYIQRIATQAGTKALHINSAMYMLGRDEI